ncbi:MAG: helix-turn-helix transcriptional regulator [Pseudomonadales bacterium]|jgi:transcriptional regulator with XRE-family HTH domain
MSSNTDFMDQAASALREARQAAGLSLREAARRAGTSHATLHAYETGAKSPSIATFLRILDACGYAVDFTLSPRIRWQDGIYRGDELEAVLDLADAFPARAPRRHMDYPVFGRRA